VPSYSSISSTQGESGDFRMNLVKGCFLRWIRRDWAALLLFVIFSFLAIYPIVPHLRSRIIGWKGDNVQFVYMTGWVAQSLLLKQSPFFDPRLNYPDGLALTTTDVPFLSLLMVTPVTILGGPILGYNTIILLSHFLSGYFVYLWLVRLTKSRVGGVIGGLSFLLMPYRIVHSYGHLQLVSSQALPLFFWALDHWLSVPSPSFRKLLLLAGATALLASMSKYYLVISLITGAVYTVISIVPRIRAFLHSIWKLAASITVGAIIGSLPYLITLGPQALRKYDVLETRIWSAVPFDFVVPSRLHPLWGRWMEQYYPRLTWVEHTLYLGLIASALALVALCWRRQEDRKRNLVWCGVIWTALVFALGTDLRLSGDSFPENPVWLPAYYMAHLPVIGFMRVWARFAVTAMLFISLLAGVGASRLIQHWPRWRLSVVVACLVLLVVDFLPGRLTSTELILRPIDQWLAAQPGDFAVAFLPAGDYNYEAMFGSLSHGKRLPAIHHDQHAPKAFVDFLMRSSDFPSPQSIEGLRGMGFRYLIINRDRFNGQQAPDWAQVEKILIAYPKIRFVATIDSYVVIEFK
jgi:hypothetical protein